MKNYVGLSPFSKTGMKDLLRLVREGLYGFTGRLRWQHPNKPYLARFVEHAPVDAAFAAKLIGNIHKNINAWIAKGDLPGLSGTVENLIEAHQWRPGGFAIRLGMDDDEESGSDSDPEDDEINVEVEEGEGEDGVRVEPEKVQEEEEKLYGLCLQATSLRVDGRVRWRLRGLVPLRVCESQEEASCAFRVEVSELPPRR